jgi:hypothetical protein
LSAGALTGVRTPVLLMRLMDDRLEGNGNDFADGVVEQSLPSRTFGGGSGGARAGGG